MLWTSVLLCRVWAEHFTKLFLACHMDGFKEMTGKATNKLLSLSLFILLLYQYIMSSNNAHSKADARWGGTY